MYKIELEDGSVKWFNVCTIMEIEPIDKGGFGLFHFNHTSIIIKSFQKL